MSSVHWLARCTCFGCSIGLLGAFASGCSDPVASPPQAAFSATFGGSSCAATVDPGPTIGIGTASATESATYADGTDGIHVGCRVVPQGDNMYVNVGISRGSTSFSFEATMPATQGSTATATTLMVSGPNTAGGVYVQSKDTPCKVSFVDGAAGRIKASYSCDGMKAGNTIADIPCNVDGFVVAENCDTQ